MPTLRALPALDGLRGVAALLVVLAHAANQGLGPALFRGVGRHGVFLFFVLSSFLLTRQLLSPGVRPSGAPGWWGWTRRRLLRVLPAYLATVLLHTWLDEWSRDQLLGHLSLRAPWFHLWTIPVELQAYLVLPVVALVHAMLGSHRSRTAAVLALAIPTLSFIAPPDYTAGFAPFLPVFLTGALLAAIAPFQGAQPGGRTEAALSRGASVLGLVGILLFLLLSPEVFEHLRGRPVASTHFHLQFPLLTLAAGALVLNACAGRGPVARFLATSPLRSLGSVSYSLYLLHVLVLTRVVTFAGGEPGPGWWLLYLGMSLSLAFAGERWFERPFRVRSAHARD